jgi:hypothetical protein
MNRDGLGVRALNAELQARLNPNRQPRIERFGTTFAPGDKVTPPDPGKRLLEPPRPHPLMINPLGA